MKVRHTQLKGCRDLALQWFEQLKAPHKQSFSVENAAHSVAFEQFGSPKDVRIEETK
jgi:hypothetical protein